MTGFKSLGINDYKTYRRNQQDVFQCLEMMLDEYVDKHRDFVDKEIKDYIDKNFADVKDFPYGDVEIF